MVWHGDTEEIKHSITEDLKEIHSARILQDDPNSVTYAL